MEFFSEFRIVSGFQVCFSDELFDSSGGQPDGKGGDHSVTLGCFLRRNLRCDGRQLII